MKKILIITDAWYPQVNGVVTVMNNIMIQLTSRGFDVVVVHPGLFLSRPFPLYPEVPLVLFPGKKMEKLFLKEKPDYVHIATEWTLGMSARAYCFRKGIPFTTSYHTNFPLYVSHYFPFGKKILASLAYRYMRWFHSPARATLVSTKTLKEELEHAGFQHITLWSFGLDIEFFKRNTLVPSSELPSPVFVYFGRCAKEKGIEEYLKLTLPGTKLVIGDGPLRKELEKKYGASAIFVGYKRGQELIDALSVCDVCVFPSRTETFGLVVIEALALGLPVAAHNVMGPRDIISSGVDGILSEDLEIAAKECLLLSREKCREKALQFSWERSADIFIKAFEETI